MFQACLLQLRKIMRGASWYRSVSGKGFFLMMWLCAIWSARAWLDQNWKPGHIDALN